MRAPREFRTGYGQIRKFARKPEVVDLEARGWLQSGFAGVDLRTRHSPKPAGYRDGTGALEVFREPRN